MNPSKESTIKALTSAYSLIFEPELIEEIMNNGRHKTIKAGTVMMDVGMSISEIPMVVSGAIKVIREDEKGNEMFLYYLGGGDACAMSMTCCIQGKVSQFKAVAEEDSTLWLVPLHFMDEWMQKYQSWKRYVFLSYQERFDELLLSVDSLAFQKMDQRLMKYLLDKKQASGDYKITKTHQEIADELNTSRVVISRLLKKLEKDEKIELHRNMIEIL